MVKRVLVVLFVVVLCGFSLAEMTPELVVSFADGTITVSAPDPADAVIDHTIYCGPGPGQYDRVLVVPMPTLTSSLDDVLGGPGIYVCSFTRSNQVGESGHSPETVPFAAIGVPATPQAAPIVEG